MLLILAFLTAVPCATTLVDCPTACRQCRGNAVPRDMMLIYCSVCEECRTKTKKRKQAARRNAQEEGVVDVYNNAPEQGLDYMEYEETYNNPDAAYLLDRDGNAPEQPPDADAETPLDVNRQRVQDDYYYSEMQYDYSYKHKPENYYKILDSLNIPEGCPIPPICDDETPPRPVTPRQTSTTTTSPTTTTTTTLAPLSCPPIPECIITTKRRRRTTTPVYYYPEMSSPPPFPYPYPCMPSCMMPAMCPCPYPQPPIQNQHRQPLAQYLEPQTPPPTPPAPSPPPTEEPTTKMKRKETSAELPLPALEDNQDGQDGQDGQDDQEDENFVNVYIGVPTSMTVQAVMER